MPILRRDIQDLNAEFAKDKNFEQLVLQLDMSEIEIEGVKPEVARMRVEVARVALESRDGIPQPPWIHEYYNLRDKGWPFRQAAYIAWASTPTEKRVPKTQQELASLLGLTSDRAISRWREKNPAITETIALMQNAPLWDGRADAFQNLIDGMNKAGDDYKYFNHLKLYLELTGDYVPTSEFVANLKRKLTGDPSELSEEQITVLAKAYDDFQKKE